MTSIETESKWKRVVIWGAAMLGMNVSRAGKRPLDTTAEYDINIGGYAKRRAKSLLKDELPHDELNKNFQS